mmetsp:Transcript_3656/g.8007  ORF Transcript_3656/g.8007 Transcript_3656/m.8007 type:complete len:190 (-) Transcript_3656:112-681(-)
MSQEADGEAGMFARGPPPTAAVDPGSIGPAQGLLYPPGGREVNGDRTRRLSHDKDGEEELRPLDDPQKIETNVNEHQAINPSSPYNAGQVDDRLPRVGDGRAQTIPPSRKDLDKDRSVVGISTCEDTDYGVEYYALQSDDEAPQMPRQQGNAAVICNAIAGVFRESMAKFRRPGKADVREERLHGSLMR